MARQTFIDRVAIAVTLLNNRYGRGDVRSVRMGLDGKGEFIRVPFGCREERRKFRIDGETVFALGHQQSTARLPEWSFANAKRTR